MSPDHDPLKPMGIQSADTVQVDAAERAREEQLARAAATAEEILELIHHTDSVAEIPNSLRLGTVVQLAETKAIPRSTR